MWRVFRDVWKATKNISPESLRYQIEEVQYCRWMSINEIEELYKKGEIFGYGDEYMAHVFALSKK